VFVLVDANTGKHCLPLLVKSCPELDSASVFEIEEGEDSKSLIHATRIWDEFLSAYADRSSILINLGGGVITDLGGFVAAGLKRGISYINVPTSLMGMADASIGGKTGVNHQGLKNQLGSFYSPEAVFIDPRFLKTLPAAQLRSGFAEVIKSALIGDPVLWHRMLKLGVVNILSMDTSGKFWQDMIMKTVSFKNRIACQDFREHKLRKILNFGHTLGHALESLILDDTGDQLLHGDAVAMGMIAATWLSQLKTGLGEKETEEISSFLKTGYRAQIGHFSASRDATSVLMMYKQILHDKKIKDGQAWFTLLRAAGKPVTNIPVVGKEMQESLDVVFN